MRDRQLTEPGAVLYKSGNRILVGFGVVEEWRAYTLDQAVYMLKDMQSFKGFRVGYMSYDFGARWNGVTQKSDDDFKTPLLHFIAPEEIRFYEEGEILPDWFGEHMDFSATKPVADLSKGQYTSRIKKIHDYLREGETYEVNFAQRFQGEFKGEPLEVFRRLNQFNPSPYACYFNFNPVTVVSCSPERLVSGEFGGNGQMLVETRPIKGTISRGETSKEDEQRIAELLGSEKNEAELNMIVDLARNDLGRVCDVGSVSVDQHRVVESYSHVHHTMSNITGRLSKGRDWLDVLKAFFPGGSITGAPKFRTMEIIDELETCGRGIYTGSAGYITPEGEFDFNILIRTIAFQQNQMRYGYHSGGAIVMDSKPTEEYKETLDKAAALEKAMGM